MNKVILLGRLAKDPEMRYTTEGVAVTRFVIAVPREREPNAADFVYCLSFGKLAESVAQFCQKGRQILLDGRLEINVKNNQSYTNIIANTVEFLAKPNNNK